MAISLLMLARRQAEPSFAAGRYGDGVSPGQRLASAGLAMGIAGGIGATLMLALVVPELVRPLGAPPLITREIPLPRPIDDTPPPIDHQRTPTPTQITTVPTPLPLPPTFDGPVIEFRDPGLPLIDPGIGTGTGGGDPPIVIEPPRPEPVFVSATRDGRYASAFQPPYPPALEREGIAGVVRVRVRIGTDGRVISVENLSATDPAFFTATQRQAINRWRFRPATRDGVPVESTQELTVRFQVPAD